MRVIHSLNGRVVEGTAQSASFMLTNKRGGYLWLHLPDLFSRYCGAYFGKAEKGDYQLYKVIDTISFAKPFEEMRNTFGAVELKTPDGHATFFQDYSDGIVIESDADMGQLLLTLDCRKMYDFDDRGRMYGIEHDGDMTIISYAKYTDSSLQIKDYEIFLAIKGAPSEAIGNWREVHYPYDEHRKDSSTLFVYDALRLPLNGRIAMSYGHDRHEVVTQAKALHEGFEQRKKARAGYCSSLAEGLRAGDDLSYLAYAAAVIQLDGLTQESPEGVFAGLPWFHQFWVRDEVISAGALLLEHRDEEAFRLVKRHLSQLLPDGRIRSHPSSTLASADSLGWICFRLLHYLKALRHHRALPLLTMQELTTSLEKATADLSRNFEHNGIIDNGPKETWMDTDAGGDVRDGYRIEIQALYIAQLKLLSFLLREQHDPDHEGWLRLEHETMHLVRRAFFGDYLKDGSDDPSVRPNVFIAYYLCPDLLTRVEWEATFDICVKKLWLGFGFSSIAKDSPLFRSEYTGRDNLSYHRGDSWFWINDLAAICMLRLNPRKYKPYIDHILKASMLETLFLGVLGHHAELSSAKELRSEGCLSQAWSAAMLIELMHEIYSKKHPLHFLGVKTNPSSSIRG